MSEFIENLEKLNPTWRESHQKSIAEILQYLGDEYNIMDPTVRAGEKTNMDIAGSFTGDLSKKDMLDQMGLFDLLGIGSVYAGQEGLRELDKVEPNKLKQTLALLNYLRQPLQTTLDRPEIGLPATDVTAGYAEGIPFAYVVSKPIKQFLRGLKTKFVTPNKDIPVNTIIKDNKNLGALPKDKTFAKNYVAENFPKFLYHSPRGRDITEGIKKYDHADFSPDRLNMPEGKGIYLSPTPLDNQAIKIDVSKLPIEKWKDLQQSGQAEGYFIFNKDIPANAIIKE